MPKVIPAILEKNIEEIKRKVRQVDKFVKWIQIDVSDGKFTPNLTWNNPKELKNLRTKSLLEVHLMIRNPLKYFDYWLNSKAKRIIFHIEAFENKNQILYASAMAHKKKKELGLALNPKTSIRKVEEFISKVDLILFLGVNPGFGGQKFQSRVLNKIRLLRKFYPRVKIGVDGGINYETGKKSIEAGADILVAGTYIFKSKNIKDAIKKLREI